MSSTKVECLDWFNKIKYADCMKFTNSIINLVEDGKLDFKEHYGFMLQRPDDIDKREWDKYVRGQWDELCKDVIALSNGDLSYRAVSAIIVIGVAEKDKKKEIVGTDNLVISKESILKVLNDRCSPSIPDITLHFTRGKKKLCIIEIPYSGQVYESSKNLIVYSIAFENGVKIAKQKSSYSKHCVFYRVGENIDIASISIINYLQYVKSGDANFKINRIVEEVENNLKFMLHQTKKKLVFDPILTYKMIKSEVKFSLDGETTLKSSYVRWMFAICLSIRRYVKFVEHSGLRNVASDFAFRRYILDNFDEPDVFFDAIENLFIRFEHLERNVDSVLKSTHELVYDVPKRGEALVVVDSRNLLVAGIGLFRMYDVCSIYIGILSFLMGNTNYLKNNPVSPYYLYYDQENDIEKVDIEVLRNFIKEEIANN